MGAKAAADTLTTPRQCRLPSALTMVAAGLGITMMPQCYRGDGLARPRLVGFDLSRTIGWAVGPDAEALLADPPTLLVEIEREFGV